MECTTRKKTEQGGFTIIEMMVSVGIFVMVLSVSIAGLLTVVDANRKAQTLRVAIDSLDLVMEEMTRNITQGRTYDCGYTNGTITPTSCASPATSFAFESNDVAIDGIRYWLENGEIKKAEDEGSGWGSADSLTTSEIFTVDHLNFYVWSGDGNSGDDQPRVLMSVGGRANASGDVYVFNVQTTATQRVPK